MLNEMTFAKNSGVNINNEGDRRGDQFRMIAITHPK
jgi:hypothetical protein